MLYYILQTIIFQLLFLLIYDLFLKKETFFNWNRWYLLSTSILSVALPFIKIERFQGVVSQEFIKLPEVLIGRTGQSASNQEALEAIGNSALSIWSWELILFIGMFIGVISLIYKVSKIVILISRSEKDKEGRLRIVKLKDSTAAFSFFNYIFLGEGLNEKDRESILKHEIIHVKHWHSLDLVFFEMMRIVFWFNPLIYFYQNRMVAIHEFIADANVFRQQDKITYYQNLLSQVFETKNISFINTFYKQSLIKKRIIMSSKSKSKQINLLKYAILFPVVVGMLIYSSCSQETGTVSEENVAVEKNLSEEDILKLRVEDLGNLTAEEENKRNEMIKSILEDRTYSTLIITDGVKTATISFDMNKREIDRINISKENNEGKIIEEIGGTFDSDAIEVPFAVIDEVPIYPGCESLESNIERRNCMADNIAQHVNKNFNTNLGKELGLTGRQRINVIFKIDANGDIIDVRSRAPHPDLETEAIRVIKTLPTFIPGKQKGKAVIVPYSLPIIFQVKEKDSLDSNKRSKN